MLPVVVKSLSVDKQNIGYLPLVVHSQQRFPPNFHALAMRSILFPDRKGRRACGADNLIQKIGFSRKLRANHAEDGDGLDETLQKIKGLLMQNGVIERVERN